MKINVKPNFFIVGAAKAGTTSLYNYLKQHPDVYFSPIKEPNFFNTDLKFENIREEIKHKINFDQSEYFSKPVLTNKHNAHINSLSNYLKLFREVKNEKQIGEASTSYLYSKKAAENIYKFNDKAKIIIILREPVSRTISHYFMDKAAGKTTNSLLSDLKMDFESKNKGYFISNLYIDLSLYYEQVKRYMDVFPKEQILFLKFENLQLEQELIIEKICNFLSLDISLLKLNNKIHNKTGLPRNSIVKYLWKFKKYFPKKNLKIKFFFKKIFLKSYKKEIVPELTKLYIEQLVNEDFRKTKKLIDNFYN